MSAAEVGTVELRPDLDAYRALLRSRLPWGIPLLVILGIRVVQDPLTALIVIVPIAALLLAGWAHLRTSRILLTPTSVEHHGLTVRDRVIARDDARGFLGVMTQSLASDVMTLVVQSRTSGRSMRVFGGLWNHEQLETIAAHAGVQKLDRPIDGQAMDALAPGSVPLRYRRPLAFALGVSVLLVAAVVLVAYLLTR